MRYFSMFSGIGGFELGIQRAFSCDREQQTDTKISPQDSSISPEIVKPNKPKVGRNNTCIGYSEIDKYAIKVYERQFGKYESCDEHAHISEKPEQEERTQRGERPTNKHGVQLHDRNRTATLCNRCKGHTNYGDATTINPTELPDFDLLVGGFPCQAFSIAGKRAGFNDTRGTLFFDIARILATKRPRHLVLENVKGLLSHDSGKTFQTILGVLSDLGYRVEWQVLNSKDFGVPQNRERIYFVGHLRGECSGEVLPITGNSPKTIEQGLVTVSAVTGVKDVNLSPTLDTMYKKGLGSKQARPAVRQLNKPTHSNDRVYSDDGISPTLNTMQGGNRQPFIAAQRGRGNPPVQTLEPQVEDKTNTLTAVAKDNLVVDMPRIRRLTPLECERLQGFPDNFTELGVEDNWTDKELDWVEISDTQRYKMCGNAVTVNTVQAVMEKLFNHG